MGLYWKDEPNNWFFTKKDFCLGWYGYDDSLCTSGVLEINDQVGGLSENKWYNWVDHRGPIFLSVDGDIANLTSNQYLKNYHVFSSDEHINWSSNGIPTIIADAFQSLVFHPGLINTYSLSNQPLTTWPGSPNNYYRGFGSTYTSILLDLKFNNESTSYYYYPLQWNPIIGLHIDAFGGTHHSYKGVIICPIVTEAKLQHASTSSSRITLLNNGSFDNLFKGDLMLNDANIENDSDATYAGISTNINAGTFSTLSFIYRTFSNAINYKTAGNKYWYFQTGTKTVQKQGQYVARSKTLYDSINVTHNNNSLYSITTKYLYSPFKINSHYNWFYGSILLQLADTLNSNTLASGGSWNAGQGSNYTYVLNHPNVSTDIGNESKSPLRGYIEDLSSLFNAYMTNSLYKIPPGSIWISWHHYNAGDLIHEDNSINQYNRNVDKQGKFSSLINSLFNGPQDVLYQFFAGLDNTELEQIYNNLSTLLGNDLRGLKTGVTGNGITVLTVSAYVPANLLNNKLGIISSYDYFWFDYVSSSNLVKLTSFPNNNTTAGMMIDLFYVVFFDNYIGGGYFDGQPVKSTLLDLNTYNGIYGKAYKNGSASNSNNQINIDYSYLKLFTSNNVNSFSYLTAPFTPMDTQNQYFER